MLRTQVEKSQLDLKVEIVVSKNLPTQSRIVLAKDNFLQLVPNFVNSHKMHGQIVGATSSRDKSCRSKDNFNQNKVGI